MSKNVVVIGGGCSAKHAAEAITKTKDLKVTLIQANKFVEWPIAMTKVLANPELHYKALSSNPQMYETPGVIYKYGVVSDVDPSKKEVTLKDGSSICYDALVVATGFSMPLIYPELGVALEDRRAEVAKVGAAIKKAECVVINGAGSVGLELAGDIRVAYPGKRVVILCRDNLLKQYPESIQTQTEAALKAMSIELIKGDLNGAPTELKLDQGVVNVSENIVSYDVFIPAYSHGPNTSFMIRAADMLDARGFIKVNGFLQSEVHPEIFAVGVSNRDEGFIGIGKLEKQWTSAANNVKAMLTGTTLKKHAEGVPFMRRPPLVLVGRGKGGWAAVDFESLPPPLKCCCCCGIGGFPCCPPPCCWPCCGPCACGYCCGLPAGEGPAKMTSGLEFSFGRMHFKGLGQAEPAPEQQHM